jgi:hypothetical protein
MTLSLDIIEKYELPKKTHKPDWDDCENVYTLPCGIEVSCLTVCGNEPTESDCLEGMDGYIYIDTEEELKELIAMDVNQIKEKILAEHPEADLSDYE